jgi:hypothetical protein
MTEIPSSVYVIIGTLIVANLGTVVTVFYGIGKIVWWVSKLDSRIATVEVEHTKDIDSAHFKIRELEKFNYNQNQKGIV